MSENGTYGRVSADIAIDCVELNPFSSRLVARPHDQYNRSQRGLQAFLRNGAGESLATRTSLVAATRVTRSQPPLSTA